MTTTNTTFDQLTTLCKETEQFALGGQDDSKLIELLDTQYKLSKKSKTVILSLIAGKHTNFQKPTSTAIKEKLNVLIGQCYMNNINPHKDGEFIGYQKLSDKISKLKSAVNKKKVTDTEKGGE